MPYVARNKSGAIIAVFREEDECAREYLSPWNYELCAFVGQKTYMENARTRDRTKVQAELRQFARDMRVGQRHKRSLADIDAALERL